MNLTFLVNEQRTFDSLKKKKKHEQSIDSAVGQLTHFMVCLFWFGRRHFSSILFLFLIEFIYKGTDRKLRSFARMSWCKWSENGWSIRFLWNKNNNNSNHPASNEKKTHRVGIGIGIKIENVCWFSEIENESIKR